MFDCEDRERDEIEKKQTYRRSYYKEADRLLCSARRPFGIECARDYWLVAVGKEANEEEKKLETFID